MSGTSSQVLNDGGELCLLELDRERSDCLSLERSSFALPKMRYYLERWQQLRPLGCQELMASQNLASPDVT